MLDLYLLELPGPPSVQLSLTALPPESTCVLSLTLDTLAVRTQFSVSEREKITKAGDT